MPVLAPLRPLFDSIIASASSSPPASVAEARAAVHVMMETNVLGLYAPHAPLASERDHRVPVAGGEITVRVYAPAPAGQPLPCHLYSHGGSFWLGTIEQFGSICRGLARDAGCVVVSVGYRLAPEHKFPTAPEDCYAALLWVAAHAAELGIDPSRISVGGASAGGNLAAVVAQMARDRGGPRLALQVLEIPMTDLTNLESLNFPDEGLVLPSGNAQVARLYLADPSEAANAYASPLLAADLGGLPPALVMTAEYDPLGPEGDAYARRLAEAGVAVEHRRWEGQFHGSPPMAALIPKEAAAYHAQVVAALRRAFGLDAG